MRAVAARERVDPLAFAELVDREFGPIVALAEQVAKGGLFAMRRAIDLASTIVDAVEGDQHRDCAHADVEVQNSV